MTSELFYSKIPFLFVIKRWLARTKSIGKTDHTHSV